MGRAYILEEFNKFKRFVISPNAPPEQIDAMKAAFFGGVATLLKLQTSLFEEDPEPTTKDLKLMQDISDELNQFAEMRKYGGARTYPQV